MAEPERENCNSLDKIRSVDRNKRKEIKNDEHSVSGEPSNPSLADE